MFAAIVQGPRIDIWDSSSGQHKPVFTVQAGHTALGGHFLWFHLGAQQLACFSLLTGSNTLDVIVLFNSTMCGSLRDHLSIRVSLTPLKPKLMRMAHNSAQSVVTTVVAAEAAASVSS